MGGDRIIPFQTLELETTEKTKEFGERCARFLSPNSIVALFGDLGAGKTTFVQGVALQLGIKAPIQSPTYTYLNCYEEGKIPLYHFDLYKLKNASDFLALGFEEYFDKGGITLIEWAERISPILPSTALSVVFSYKELKRTVNFNLGSSWD
jgi:tRNA threonylcarbamoyladenosine biosynthesis protein TsaE